MWSWRMLQITAEAKYADLMEWQLYNAVMPGLSLDGQHYFYQNPLADEGKHRREKWFGCACCPPNVARLLAQLPGYFYSVSDRAVWINLYGQSSFKHDFVQLEQATNYPWDGSIQIEIQSGGEFTLNLRIPAWCQNGAALSINGKPVGQNLTPGSFVAVAQMANG